MKCRSRSLFIVGIFLLVCNVSGEHNDDKRCRCICPSVDSVLNTSKNSKLQIFTATVLPNQCDCDSVVLPAIGSSMAARDVVLCLRCECKFESRNPGLIKFVVIMLVLIISFLVMYMAFLVWLRSITIRKQRFYRGARGEEIQDLMKAEDPDD